MKHIFFIGLLVSTSTFANYETGNTLYAKLISDSGIDRMYSAGVIVGVVDGLDQTRKNGFCFSVPDQVTVGQLSDIVRSFLKDSPSVRHYKAGSLIQAALDKAFPCPSSSSR